MNNVLITGFGTGFGHKVTMRLAGIGNDVIHMIEVSAQMRTLKQQANAPGVQLGVEKLDVTDNGYCKKALGWKVEISVDNAAVLEGGAVVDVPTSNLRHEFEVNVTGSLLLTQDTAQKMLKRRKGRIDWVSSRERINVNPSMGIYSALKHVVEAIAQTMSLELGSSGSISCPYTLTVSSPASTTAVLTRGKIGRTIRPSGSTSMRSLPSRELSSRPNPSPSP